MSIRNNEEILNEIAKENGFELKEVEPLTGGDINEVFLLKSSSDRYVIKLNSAQRYPHMFEAEKLGLETLLEPGVIDVPEPVASGEIEAKAYLLLEFKESAPRKSGFWDSFAEQLANLHKQSNEEFGFQKDNYIGSLPQYNEPKKSASEFYISMRLEPQFKMAREKGFDLNIPDSFFQNCEKIIPSEKASLIHGDLWNGNFITNSKGEPCLIDPAVAFAPREMDLGMMKLFGGFDQRMFNVYNEYFPLENDWKERIPLWQLYYLLVHLNIFGASYQSQVTSIIRQFS